MNAQGYPCVGAATTDGCAIFGFQYIRVNVLNSTPQITESATTAVIPQNLSATAVGDVNDMNFHGPYLVAVAKYHRNTCHKPDLSGQRVQSYAPIPQISIAEPVCAAGQVVRTAYQEISVSKSARVTAAVLNGASTMEIKFHFTADPIPVNATDLFIQVVYRGPMGDAVRGQEPDALAVGTMDVRDPTFVVFWDNTDYFWSGSWIGQYSTYPHESSRDFWVCGSGAPAKLLFEYFGGGYTRHARPVRWLGFAGTSAPRNHLSATGGCLTIYRSRHAGGVSHRRRIDDSGAFDWELGTFPASQQRKRAGGNLDCSRSKLRFGAAWGARILVL